MHGQHQVCSHTRLIGSEVWLVHADVAFADQLQAGGFATYNATAADESNAREYGIKGSEIPANLKREADKYIAFKVLVTSCPGGLEITTSSGCSGSSPRWSLSDGLRYAM